MELSQKNQPGQFTVRVPPRDGNMCVLVDLPFVFVWDEDMQGIVAIAPSFIFSFQITP